MGTLTSGAENCRRVQTAGCKTSPAGVYFGCLAQHSLEPEGCFGLGIGLGLVVGWLVCFGGLGRIGLDWVESVCGFRAGL